MLNYKNKICLISDAVLGGTDESRRQLDEDARRIASELQKELGGGDHGDRNSTSKSRSSRKKRSKRKRRRSTSSSSSSEEESRRRRKKRVPTSRKIPRDQWPEGYDTEGMDDLSFREAQAIKDREDKLVKRNRDSLPGVRVARRESKLKMVEVPAGIDDGVDNLHEARYGRSF